ncbi:MAG: PaaI family thioesterase [Eggerthellaceae bacterium]|nr:PaaI family thioesterase [Eggerthellaceae bacterium]
MNQEFNDIEDIRDFFTCDLFASEQLGAFVESYNYETGEAVTTLEIQPHHLNGHGKVMGGVYFTLADYALAVCCNVNQPPTSSVSSSINFMKECKGDVLVAIANPDRSGRRLGFYTIDVYDNLNNHCARMTATCARV